jgi:hypothetical protein
MKDRKHKYLEDLVEEYMALTEELEQIPVLIEKVVNNYKDYSKKHTSTIISADEGQYAFKVYNQLKKHNERKKEVEQELAEIEALLKDFLQFFEGHTISFEKKDDNKAKVTFLLSLENGELRCNK